MAKENISKVEREPTIWEDIFTNDTLDKGFISKLFKRTHTTSHQEAKQSNQKMDKGLGKTFAHGRHTEGPQTYERIALAIKEMEIKTTVKYQFTPVRMAIINKSTSKCWRGYKEKGTLVDC